MIREILLIEDDPNYRQSIRVLFQGESYQFVEAGSPGQGITALTNHPFLRVILLDLHFNDGKATAVLEHIKHCSSDYRVIVLTGHDELLPAERAREYEVFNYLPKTSNQAIRFSVEQAFKDLERKDLARKLGFLLELQKKVNANINTEETLDEICEFVRSIVGAYTCHIRVYDIKHGDYRLGGFAGTEKGVRSVFERPRTKGELFSGKVVESGEAEVFQDLQNMEEFCRFKEAVLTDSELSSTREEYWQKVRSAYIVPISTGLFGNFVDAVLNVSSEAVDFFNNEKQSLVNEYQTLASLTIAKDWLHRKGEDIHQDYSKISQMLNEITDRLRGSAALREIYEVVTRKISEIISAEVVTIFLYNEATDRVESVAELRGDELLASPTEAYRPGQSLTGSVYASDETIHLPRLADDVLVKPLDDERYDHAKKEEYLRDIPSNRIEHYLGVPIRMGGRIRGVLRAINKKSSYYEKLGRESPLCLLERGFSRDCRNAMEITASHLAVAIRNAELLGEKDRQLERISWLGEVGQFINSALDIDEVLKLTIEKMAEVMQAEICLLFLKDGEDRLILNQCFGIPMISGASYGVGEGIIGGVAKTGQPQLMTTTEGYSGKYDSVIRTSLTEKHGEQRHIASLMAVPIKAKGIILGAMTVYNKASNRSNYVENDLELFQMFAGYVGVALENARLYKIASDRLAIAERNAALSLLVTAVGHEINNTCGIIPTNVTGLRKRMGSSDKEIETMLASIDDAAKQATEFANEIAGFSAKWRGEKEALDLNHIIEEAMKLEKYKNSTNVRLVVTPCEEPLICEIYRTPFIQIVRNIVINAFQAIDNLDDGEVRISTFKHMDSRTSVAVIEVQDNGPGIRPAHIPRIFDADFTTKPKGNGVGLWLARTQLELIGGKIKVQSELGHGAKFIISIPLS